jgi:hypothetical protein
MELTERTMGKGKEKNRKRKSDGRWKAMLVGRKSRLFGRISDISVSQIQQARYRLSNLDEPLQNEGNYPMRCYPGQARSKKIN